MFSCFLKSLCVSHFVCPCLCARRILDVQPNRLSVGGVRSIEPVLHRRGQVATHDFVGCIMEFAVNGRPLEPSQALASRGILDRSAPQTPPFPTPVSLLPPSSSGPSVFSNLLDSRCGTSVHTLKPSREFFKKMFFNTNGRFLTGGIPEIFFFFFFFTFLSCL